MLSEAARGYADLVQRPGVADALIIRLLMGLAIIMFRQVGEKWSPRRTKKHVFLFDSLFGSIKISIDIVVRVCVHIRPSLWKT